MFVGLLVTLGFFATVAGVIEDTGNKNTALNYRDDNSICPTEYWKRRKNLCVLEVNDKHTWKYAKNFCKDNYDSHLTDMSLGAEWHSSKRIREMLLPNKWTSLNTLRGFLEWDYFWPYPFNQTDSMLNLFYGELNESSCIYVSETEQTNPYKPQKFKRNIPTIGKLFRNARDDKVNDMSGVEVDEDDEEEGVESFEDDEDNEGKRLDAGGIDDGGIDAGGIDHHHHHHHHHHQKNLKYDLENQYGIDRSFCEKAETQNQIFISLLNGELQNFDSKYRNEVFGCFQNILEKDFPSTKGSSKEIVKLIASECERKMSFNCYRTPVFLELQEGYSRCPSGWFGARDSKFCYQLTWFGESNTTSPLKWCGNEQLFAPQNELQIKMIGDLVKADTSLGGAKNRLGISHALIHLDFHINGSEIYYGNGQKFGPSIQEYFPQSRKLITKDGCNIMISDTLNLQLISLGCQNASWIICQRPKLPKAEVKKEKTVVIAVKLTKMSEQVMTCGKGSNHIWYRDDLFMHSSHDYKFNPFLRFSQSGNNHQLQGLYECRSYDSDLHLISHTSYEVIFTDVKKYILRVQYGVRRSGQIIKWLEKIKTVTPNESAMWFPIVFVPRGISVVNRRMLDVKAPHIGWVHNIIFEMDLFVDTNMDYSQFDSSILNSSFLKNNYYGGEVYREESPIYPKYNKRHAPNEDKQNDKSDEPHSKKIKGEIDIVEELKKYYPLVNAIANNTVLQRKKFDGISYQHKPQEVIIRSSEGCMDDEVRHRDTRLRFGWGLPGEARDSTNICANQGRKAVAEARCSGSRDEGYAWLVGSANCVVDNDELTRNLDTLLKQMSHTKEGREVTISRLGQLTDNTKNNLTAVNLDMVSEILEKASLIHATLSTKAGVGVVKTMNDIMAGPKELFQKAHNMYGTTLKLRKAVEELMSKVELEGIGDNMTVVEQNIAVSVVMVNAQSTVAFGVFQNHTQNDINSTREIGYLYGHEVARSRGLDASIQLPKHLFSAPGNAPSDQVSFVIYHNTKLFPEATTHDSCGGEQASRQEDSEPIRSMVASASVNGRNISSLKKEKIKISFRVDKNDEMEFKCMWSGTEQERDGQGWWGDGLETKGGERGVVHCFSDHLTNFAVLAGYRMDPNLFISKLLKALSIIGCSLSIFCLLLLILFYIFATKKDKSQDQVALLNLAISLILLNIVLLAGLDRTENCLGCKIVAAVLLYLLLVSFACMLVESVLQYYKFKKVFNTHVSHFKVKSTVPVWGFPALIVMVVAIVDHRQFRGREHYCWLADDAFAYAFLLPLAIIITTNIIFFIIIIKAITCDRPVGMQTNQSRSRLTCLQLQVAVCCFVVMGLTWTFALLARGEAALTMQFLFAIFNSLQGVFIFLLFNIRDKRARKAWVDLFRKSCACCFREKKKKSRYNFYSSVARMFNRSDEDSSREMVNTANTTLN